MRDYLKAQWLLAPLLAAALPTGQEVKVPHALVSLDINSTSDGFNHYGPTLRLDILESTSPCGYGNVTLDGQSLAQDESGVGSGSIITENGNTILANWSFSCVHLEDEFQGQLMTFEVTSLDEVEVHDVRFAVQFQQMAPPSISFINGTVSITEAAISATTTGGTLSEGSSTTLDDELAELKSMMRQLAALEQAITSKVRHISETYDFKIPEFDSFSRCDSLKCIVKTMYRRVKHMASRVNGHGLDGAGLFGNRMNEFGWRFHHGNRHDWFPHDGCAHRNHSFPHPHPRPHPHPPRPPHHQPPHGPPPNFHPPPPPHEFYEEQPPRVLPPPSHRILEDDMAQESFTLTTEPENGMPPIRNFGDDEPVPPSRIINDDAKLPPPMIMTIPDHHGRPPPPGSRAHGGMPPHSHHNPHFEHRDPPRPLPIIHIIVAIVFLALLISAICTRCFSVSRRSRRSTCTDRCQSRETRRHCRRNAWANRRAAIGTRYSEVVGWLRESARRQEAENEEKEKEAIVRQLHGSEREEEDALSTTMEQEIAQFRAVASVVGDLVAAEEGRSREYAHERQQHQTPPPPSPTSAFPDYASIDEELPAYDEGSNDSRFVADGFRYTPGRPYYTSIEPPPTESSLDEHLGRKD
ncbi:hypothetical protein F5Y11DRAFT_351481 [Daldinia sp. FL1419]|nr:hypothetical protein F5Y11DRAFT_351481 [Daldinia sp. FL1419]